MFLSRLSLRLLAILAILASTPALAQDRPLRDLAPGNPLMVLEMDEPSATLTALKELQAFSLYLKSPAFTELEGSKLYLKLKERAEELSTLVGHDISLDTLVELIGHRGMMAVYDIGQLKVLVASRMSPEEQAALFFAQGEEAFEERRVGEQTFRVKDGPESEIAFAFHRRGDLLLVSTEVNLLKSALALLDDPGQPHHGQRPELKRMEEADPQGVAACPTRLFLDMERLAVTPHYRSYFLQRQGLEGVRAVWSGLRVSGNSFIERRLILGPLRPAVAAGTAIKGAPAKGAVSLRQGPVELGEVCDYLSWPIPEEKDVPSGTIRSRAYWAVAEAEALGTVGMGKAVVLNVSEDFDVEALVRAINRRLAEALPAPPQGYGLIKGDGVWSFSPLPLTGGMFLAREGALVVMATDRALLDEARQAFSVADEGGFQATVDLAAARLWTTAFRQMIPSHLFADQEARDFFINLVTPSLEALASFGRYRRSETPLKEDMVLQEIRLGE